MAIAGIPNPGVYAYPPGPTQRRSSRRRAEGIGIKLGDAAHGSVVDVGEGGVRVKTADWSTFERGSLVSFTLPDGNPIQANCELVWSDASGAAGLRFLAFADNSKTKLASWLAGRTVVPSARVEAAPVVAPPVLPAEALPANPTPAAGPDWTTEADDPGLEELVRSMMLMTAADGAAIALRVGDAIVCRATAGNAPRVGVKLNPDAGLSGRCLHEAEPVLCRDSETDSTVNAEACRALRLRAALLVPVKRETQVEGVLEVFSSRPDIFDIGDVAALQRLAEKMDDYLPAMPMTSGAPMAVIEAAKVVEAPPAKPVAASVPLPEPFPTPTAAKVEAAPAAEVVHEEPPAEIAFRPASMLPNAVFRLIDDPHYRQWKRAVYWGTIALRNALSLLTLTVPLSYLGYFLIGPVIRPLAIEGTAVFRYMNAVVQPGMEMAEYFFSFRAVVNGWNLMFLVVAAITMAGRNLALKPIQFVLKQVEDKTRPRKRYAYVPYLPHKTEFR